jgi:EAL domain-containing protein (putative c-di-GMP-specific phosphodiesterase class I)
LAGEDGSNRLFVKALNDVAIGMNKQVIAEWVETPEVLKLLQDMGAQFGQGYLFQKPTLLDGSHEHNFAQAAPGLSA